VGSLIGQSSFEPASWRCRNIAHGGGPIDPFFAIWFGFDAQRLFGVAFMLVAFGLVRISIFRVDFPRLQSLVFLHFVQFFDQGDEYFGPGANIIERAKVEPHSPTIVRRNSLSASMRS
jgi:hypothetical protein